MVSNNNTGLPSWPTSHRAIQWSLSGCESEAEEP